MKKIIVFLCLCLLGWQIFAYNASPTEQARVSSLTAKINEMIDGDKEVLWSFYTQLLDIGDYFSGDQRMTYMITSIANNLHTQLQQMKLPALLDGKTVKEIFVHQYADNIIKEHEIPQKCRDRWQFLDDISFVHNLPTAITMATRYAESTCGFYLPIHATYGSNGPFQIITKDYGTGAMTEKLYRQTVKDFVDFARSKINSYQRSNRNEWLTVNLTYSNFDFTGVVRFGSLYNGLSGSTIKGDIQPMKRWYVFNNYEPAYSGAVRHWLMPMFIKTLEREIDNVYPKILGNVAGVY